ncbi:MAG: helix-turn-helix domain-containing protein [Saccharothrix sp.]|nr:helix-turn-helix domain-containing protein [Saccharothrix sp.]
MLRLRVVAALESGKVEGYWQAAEVFGVSERSVGTWWRAYRRVGRDGLATREGRPGPAELITRRTGARCLRRWPTTRWRSC